MYEASVSLQVLPDTGTREETFRLVDEVIDYIIQSGVKYVVGPFETTMEGDLDTLLQIVAEAQRICARAGARDVYSVVKIAYCETGVATVEEKTGKYQRIPV